MAGAATAGAETKSAGVITTPGVAFLARTLPADAGVVISASHNVYRDNGIKVFAPSGRKLDEETERLIESDVFAAVRTVVGAPDTATLGSNADDAASLRKRYLDFLVDDIGRDLSLSGLRLVLDCANGAASQLAPELFRRLGARVTVVNNEPDGTNINLDSGSLHPEGLQNEVVSSGAKLGVAFDGDADRVLFVDATGRLVNGDGSLWVLARYLRERDELKDDTVVATVMSNIGLELAFESEGINLIRTDVGDKYVLTSYCDWWQPRWGTVRTHHFSSLEPSRRRDDHNPQPAADNAGRKERTSRTYRGFSGVPTNIAERGGKGQAAICRGSRDSEPGA